MRRRFFTSIFIITLFIIITACSSESESDPGNSISYTAANPVDGFSSAYLDQKTFFRPENYQGNDFIYMYQFNGLIINWSDNLFNSNGSASYSIVNHNGINGILVYNDGVYDLFYNIHSVEADHLNVCYTYTGIDTVMLCDISQTLKWYFDRATAENNYP